MRGVLGVGMRRAEVQGSAFRAGDETRGWVILIVVAIISAVAITAMVVAGVVVGNFGSALGRVP